MQLPELVVFDVDGTLIGHDGRCHERTRVALADLRAAGVTVAIATGRPLALAPSTIAEIGPVDYAACGNGASLLDCANGVLLRDACLPSDFVEPAISSLRSRLPGVGFALECGERVIEEDDFAWRVPPSLHEPPVADVLAEIATEPDNVRKVIVFHREFDADLAELAEIVDEVITDERVEVQYGAMLPIVEVATSGDHKAVALDVLIEHLGISADDAVAFGDGTNDVEMLQWAGTGIAMGNAAAPLRAIADDVADRVDQGGVAPWIERRLRAAPRREDTR